MQDKRKGAAKKHLLIISLLLIIAAFGAFWQVTRGDFITLDDAEYVTDNRHVQDGLTVEGILWAFATGRAGNWHPLAWISHMVDVQLFGLQPGWHHLTSLLLHLASTLLLFLVLNRMTKAFWRSAFVAALFSLHPLHVESVAWVAERKDVLSTFFWMLTMGLYVSYVARPGLTRYLALILCFALGLMAKPMLVTLPFVLLLLDYWPLRRLEQKPPQEPSSKDKSRTRPVKAPVQPTGHWPLIRPLLIEKIPFFVLIVLSSIVTYLVQQHGGAVRSLGALPASARVANALVSYATYLVKMLWPAKLSVFYPHPGWWPLWQVLGSAALLIAITVLAIRGAKKRPYAAVGWLWYVGTLVPVIGIVQVGNQAMADRYTYIPLVGLFIIIAWAVPELFEKWPYRKEALIALSAACLLCLFLITWRQVGYWRNSIALYDHALDVADANSLIHNNRGVAYTNLGKYTEAIADFGRAIEINPRYEAAYYNRGAVYGSLGKYTEAIADFDRAIEINPRYIEVYTDRGVAYTNLGKYTEAIADFDRAVEINPRYVEAYTNRGVAYGSLGKYTEAIADFNRAIEINPRYAEAYYNRGVAYDRLGNREHAIDDTRRAARLGHEGARNSLRSHGIDW
ncbi:MAG TPA: tetratricopeptide repeat protein [Syntrophorhabdales bacterium]|nr:tetratricopeptide repeat protein [Syntrophorhabdales bacterium]